MAALKRVCKGRNTSGEACRANVQSEIDWCFMHDPERQDEVREARKAGGQRRRREGTIALAYDLGELDTVVDLRRVLRIALLDTVSLDNGVNRSRTLVSIVQAGLKLIESGELEDRVTALEDVLGPRIPAGGRKR